MHSGETLARVCVTRRMERTLVGLRSWPPLSRKQQSDCKRTLTSRTSTWVCRKSTNSSKLSQLLRRS